MSLAKDMGDKHEKTLAEAFGARVSPGSGNQWHKPADGRQNRYEVPFAFAWDGKSTRAKSISVTREMLDKIVEQAHGERPMIGLRFYGDDRLRQHEDWVVLRLDDLVEMLMYIDTLLDPDVG